MYGYIGCDHQAQTSLAEDVTFLIALSDCYPLICKRVVFISENYFYSAAAL